MNRIWVLIIPVCFYLVQGAKPVSLAVASETSSIADADSATTASWQPAASQPANGNPMIQMLVQQVSSDSMLTTIEKLEDFGTRYEFSPKRDLAADYLFKKFKSLGYTVESDWFVHDAAQFVDLASAGNDSIWCAGITESGSMIVFSADQGRTWSVLYTAANFAIHSIVFSNHLEGWICGSHKSILHTIDGGHSWEFQMGGGAEKDVFYDIDFSANGLGIAVGNAGIVRSEDFGKHWQKIELPHPQFMPVTFFNKAFVFDGLNAWLAGSSGTIGVSHDGGLTWGVQNTWLSAILESIYFYDEQRGVAVGEQSTILTTTNGGRNWHRCKSIEATGLNFVDAVMADSSTIIAASADGRLFRSIDTGATWQEEYNSIANPGGMKWQGSILQLQDASLAACFSYTTIIVKPFGEVWRSCADVLPQSLTRRSRNIVATRQGDVTPAHEVVLCAHYDSISDQPLSSAPGANDNASGVSALIEAARLVKDLSFASTIRFIAFAGEEVGLLGSKHYCGKAAARGDDIVAAINCDMIGCPVDNQINRFVIGGANKNRSLIDSVIVYNQRYQLGADLNAIAGLVFGSDHRAFTEAGYEALLFSQATRDEIDQDPNYHQTTDLSGTIHPGFLRLGGQLALVTLAEIARPLAAVGVETPQSPPQGQTDPAFALTQNYPNPFNASTRIEFTLAQRSHVEAAVYNLAGQKVSTLIDQPLASGLHSLQWLPGDLGSGLYFLVIKTEHWHDVKMMHLIR